MGSLREQHGFDDVAGNGGPGSGEPRRPGGARRPPRAPASAAAPAAAPEAQSLKRGGFGNGSFRAPLAASAAAAAAGE